MAGIPASTLSKAARELSEEVPWARAIAQRLGKTFETLTAQEADAVREAAKDPDILATARKAVGNLGRPVEEVAGPTPTSVRANLENPPAVQAQLADAVYEESHLAPAAKSMPALPPGEAQRLLSAPRDLAPRPAPTPPIAKSASANTATAAELDSLATKLKKPAAAAAVGTAALAASDIGEDVQPPVQDAASPDAEAPKAAGPSSADPVSPGGSIDPKFISELPKFSESKYSGPGMPSADLNLPETVEVDGKQVRPVELMAKAQQDLVAATNRLADQYKAERDVLKQRELFEGIVNAVGHLAAGWYGMKHGVDMSGTKFDVTDWVAQQDALRRHYDALSGIERDKYGAAEKTAGAASLELQQRRTDEEQRWQRNSRIYEAAAQRWNQENDLAFRKWQGEVKGVELKNQIKQWNSELAYKYDNLDNQLARAQTAAEAKVAAAQRRDMHKGEALGKQAQQLLLRAANAKNQDVGSMMLQQSRQLNERARELAGAYAVPPSVYQDPRGGNSVWQLGMGKDIPGPPGSATPKQAVKSFNEAATAQAASSDLPPEPARKTVRHKASGATRLLTPDEIRRLPNPQDFELVD